MASRISAGASRMWHFAGVVAAGVRRKRFRSFDIVLVLIAFKLDQLETEGGMGFRSVFVLGTATGCEITRGCSWHSSSHLTLTLCPHNFEAASRIFTNPPRSANKHTSKTSERTEPLQPTQSPPSKPPETPPNRTARPQTHHHLPPPKQWRQAAPSYSYGLRSR